MSVTFEYLAMDREGVRRRGDLRAPTKSDAYRRLTSQGLTPLLLKAQRERSGRSARRIRTRELAHFTFQLGTLLGARIGVGDGLRSLAEQEEGRALGEIIHDVADSIEAGSTISEAMGAHRAVFGDIYVDTLAAAERTGNLVQVLEYLAETLETSHETAQQLRSAMLYPLCVVLALAGAVTFLIIAVVPRFAAMFERRGVDLPLFTEILAATGVSMRNFWWAWLLAIAGGVMIATRARRSASVRLVVDRLLHRAPVMRDILVGAGVARFARVLGLSLSSGLNLIEALEMAGRASGRPMLIVETEKMVEHVRGGGRLSEALRECDYMPPFARRLISTGEEAAELPRMCTIVARRYERDASTLARNLVTVIEPILVVAIAAIVLMVALAIYLPMWNMVKIIG
ncbi:MAG: type II secretion system F family protein [Phycisphaerales bacterium JB039]